MVKLVDLNGKWAAAIGQSFVAFGSIEHLTVTCLQEIPKDRIQRSVRSFKLGQRIDLIHELLEAHPGHAFEQLAAKLSRAKELLVTRNLIAHNPLVLGILHSDGGFTHREAIVSLRGGNRRIELRELQAFAAECEQLASELHGCTEAAVKALRGGSASA
ncbi:hypothetical protein F0A17_18945 [Billgrantia pellis]|uniref:Uncharacterized protein n=1 Tax=Billgrantia pellis TaxID=2606936 RepID=A0A7V7KGL1_9GAMM|nr:hypothetical protein [Halomonas pellis]KAA0009967.1 hypothetical protein F0A17_18945 [Halomonas pellis]